ncbi:hypothetical protein [Gordonia sp. SL306]|uniref:hypothetical protein n=1 Tax=Gordonia sp. SL306 TaxID=2995145 RepID=UPI00226D78F6|nr:hypothetical protein [Gordonia sp. SL306]WAC57558.1 hypothetical protein OVA31_10150 [Gordonia sp. SL306]
MPKDGWEFWRLVRVDDGSLEWLAGTRPNARATIDQHKVWTLIPNRSIFVANWIVTEDHHRDSGFRWTHENIDIDDARKVALAVPEIGVDELQRISKPESELTLDQVDRYSAQKVLGKRVADALSNRRFETRE